MLAIKEGELWRQQPLTDWWPQWSAEDSETLRGYLMHSNTRWSRNVPSFMITPQGQVNMSWGGAGRVPLLVVDQLRGDDDDIEPPQHPECTYTALKRVWLRNLTVIARSLPRADIDWGHLHDYGKALRLSVVSACNIMHSPHPRNYHTRVAMWELAQEPQPAPLTAEQGAFKAHREKRIREAQKRHQSLEAHWRRTMRNFQRRAQEAEDWELTRYLETTDDTAGPAATKRPCVNPAGRATETVPQGDKACHGNLRGLTHREERERDAMVRYSIEDTRQSQEAPCTQQKAEEGEQESATTAVNVNKENAAQAAPAATLRGEGEAPAPGTTKEAAGQAGTGTKETKPTQVLRLRAAGLRVEEVLPRSEVMTPRGKGSTWATSRRREMEPQTPSATDDATDRADTSTKETKPTQVLRLRAAGLWGGEEVSRSEVTAPLAKGSSRAASLRREGEPQTASVTDEAAGQAGTSAKETKSTQVLRLMAAGPWGEEGLLRSDIMEPSAKRSRSTPDGRWTVAKETDCGERESSLRQYLSRETSTATPRDRLEYPGPLLFGIDLESRKLHPHIEPGATESLLRGLDDAIDGDSRLGRIRTIEEWRQSAASGYLDNLGRAMADRMGEHSGRIAWTRWRGAPRTHMAQVIMDNVVQELKREHLHHTSSRRGHVGSHHSAARAQQPQERDGNKDRTLAPAMRKESNKLAQAVAEEVTQQLNEESTSELKATELRDKWEAKGQATKTPNACVLAAGELSEDMSAEEDDPPWQEGWQLPTSLRTLLEYATEVLWAGLSTKEIGIFMREVAATIDDSTILRGLGSDKQAWRSQEAMTELGTRGEVLHERLRLYPSFNGPNSDDKMNVEASPGQAIINAAWAEWLREGATTAGPQSQEHPPRTTEPTTTISGAQRATEVKGDTTQLRRGRGCVGPLRRKGTFTFEDGNQIQGHIRMSSRPTSAIEQPEEWNAHRLMCQQGCDLLPPGTPQRLMTQLRAGEAMTISFHMDGQDGAVAVLFMRR